MPNEPLTPDSETGRLIQRLGYAGLFPFILFALLMWLVTPEVHPLVAIALAGYGATIASFLGGSIGASACDKAPPAPNCT